ncbi:Methyltransf_7 domain-containing protein [Cephalotus follicularis]|uniref:Methyltransf_7 domain-containing protein n=1 Tax=Cephalotus follicularis TaxID=3775 RepID=A0A1Q3AP24_CEPFO|nr:Methyltransf_7 domain-containing protein [Cephalotus follicularis]
MQEEGSNRAKILLTTGIHEKLIIGDHFSAFNTHVFRIADLGCSVGPNTFASVKTIVEAVEHKYRNEGLDSQIPEFQVFFNDHFANDFNTLFNSLPSQRPYMAAGVPGSFHHKLFPKASMNFMHSSFATHWLTKVPEEVTKQDSSAWNKGSITYVGGSSKVVEAYRAQYFKDMEGFFRVRSVELAENGLLVLLIPCRPEGSHPSESALMNIIDRLGYALHDMAKEGVISEALIDSFNVPIYYPTPDEVKEVVSSNECLSIEISEVSCYPKNLRTPEDARVYSLLGRSTLEGILCKHFGSEVIDELFERYTQKLEEFSKTPFFNSVETFAELFLLVKRIAVSQ